MMEYLLKSMLCLVVLLLIHRLFLQREVMHQFNRFFLLGAVVFSFVIPFNLIEIKPEKQEIFYSEVAESEFTQELVMPVESYSSENSSFQTAEAPAIPWDEILLGVYVLISIGFLIRFIRNIKILTDQVRQNVRVTYKGVTLILLPKASLPFSFLKYVFVSKTDFENGDITDAIIEHEYTHVKEGHSYDILLIELLLIPFWFHPGLYLAKHAIRLNHEFIADQVALKSTSIQTYQQILLSMALVNQRNSLVSNLNFSLTKKRLEMMRKNSNPSWKWLKILVLVPVLGAMIYVFSEKVVANIGADSPITTEGLEKIPNSENNEMAITILLNGKFKYQEKEFESQELASLIEGLNEKPTLVKMTADSKVIMGVIDDYQQILRDNDVRQIKYIQSDFNSFNDQNSKEEFYKETTFYVIKKDGSKVKKSFDELTEKQIEGLINPPSKPKKESPSKSKFEEWKNAEKFALWLDGKPIPNEELNRHSSSDIVSYVSSLTHLNARNEKYPQPYQVSLFSDKGYDLTYGKDSGFGNSIRGTVTLKEDDQEGSVNQNNNSLTVIEDYVELNDQYEKFRKEGSHFVDRSKEEQEKLTTMFSELGSLYFQVPFQDKPKVDRPIHPFAPYLKLEANGETYYKLKEDLTADELSQLPPPPPPAKDQIAAYKEVYRKYELMLNSNRNYKNITIVDREKMYKMYNDLQVRYLDMPSENKREVRMVNFPFIRLEENGRAVFKAITELSPEQRALMNC